MRPELLRHMTFRFFKQYAPKNTERYIQELIDWEIILEQYELFVGGDVIDIDWETYAAAMADSEIIHPDTGEYIQKFDVGRYYIVNQNEGLTPKLLEQLVRLARTILANVGLPSILEYSREIGSCGCLGPQQDWLYCNCEMYSKLEKYKEQVNEVLQNEN